MQKTKQKFPLPMDAYLRIAQHWKHPFFLQKKNGSIHEAFIEGRGRHKDDRPAGNHVQPQSCEIPVYAGRKDGVDLYPYPQAGGATGTLVMRRNAFHPHFNFFLTFPVVLVRNRIWTYVRKALSVNFMRRRVGV
jgi:hypothetical protein